MNNNRVPSTEGIKYAGSKLKLLPYIYKIILNLPNTKTFLDGFSGSTRVAQMAAKLGFDTTANDISFWSQTFARCYLLANNRRKYYQEILDYLNSLKGYSGWFTENYGGRKSENKKLFQIHNTKKLDAIRDEIDKLELSKLDKSVILTSLILALDKVDSALGHYSSYLYEWSPRSYNKLELVLPKKFKIRTENHVYRKDIFKTINNSNNYYDIAYLDPPYGSNNEKMPASRVRYNSYYHIWKTIILNDKPKLFGKANRREDSRDTITNSIFEEFRSNDKGEFYAMLALEKLIRQIKARYVLLSYSSGGRATKESLIDILTSNGKLMKSFEIDYKKNVMASMKWTEEWSSNKKNIEYIFVIKKS